MQLQMGRKRTKRYSVVMPPGLRQREQRSGRVYYYLDAGGKPRREIPLGDNYQVALQKWAQLSAPIQDGSAHQFTFSWLADQYLKRVSPQKALRTQRDNTREMKSLASFFTSGGDAPLDEIKPQHVKQFLEWRGQTAPIRANREKALLSHMFNWARENGYMNGANPCSGVKAHTESGRDFYVTDELLENILKVADTSTGFALRLMYLSGQRRADVLAMKVSQIAGGYLQVVQQKTKAAIRISLISEDGGPNQLGSLIMELQDYRQKVKTPSDHLLVMEQGQVLTEDALRFRFDLARERCQRMLLELGRKDLAGVVKNMQMRDLRAKAATDIETATGSAREAQKLLAHKQQGMTEHYIRKRQGMIVNPTK
jgi:integrase